VKDPSRPVTEDHAMRMFEARESARASPMVRTSFIHVGVIEVRGADSGYILTLDEAKVQEAAEFREVWGHGLCLREID
jgi:hypothetical protein